MEGLGLLSERFGSLNMFAALLSEISNEIR
jgi:hypothetical protein